MSTRLFFSKTLLLITMSTMLFSCNKEIVLTTEEFPSGITEYIAEHFAENAVLQVVEDNDGFLKTYDVVLEDGIKLEFDKDSKVKKIKSKKKLPNTVIPVPISQYVATNYEENDIIGWEGKQKKQTVELDNELILEFDLEGKFKRIEG